MSVSVIIPVHNGEKTIKRAIDSVINQTARVEIGEIICVMNCCTDNTEEILNSYNSQIKILKCDEKGIVPALNTGLLVAKGNWIARQDADDYWFPHKLQLQLDFLYRNPWTKILGTQIRFVDPVHFKPTGTISNNPVNDSSIKMSLLNAVNPIAHPSVIFSRDILLRTGGYSDCYPLAEDLELWLKSIRWFKFANLPDILVDYTSTQNPAYTPISPQVAAHNRKTILQYFGTKNE